MSDSRKVIAELRQRLHEAEAKTARLAEAEAREAHIKQVLLAVRNVNQLIVAEDDPFRLIERACENLTETLGYLNAWIALFDVGDERSGGEGAKRVVATASSGFDGGFEVLAEQLTRNQFPGCTRRALQSTETIVVEDPSTHCRDCPVAGEYGGRAGLCRALIQDGRTYGVLAASVPPAYAHDDEEQSLFEEVAGDLAFALHKIEMARRLAESEQRYREIFEGSRDGYVMVDAAGHIVDANGAYCEMLGYSLDELRGLPSFYAITPERWHAWEASVIWQKRLLQQGYSGLYEKEYLRKDGTVFPVELRAHAVRGADGALDYLWANVRDITERKQAEEELAHSHDLMRYVIEHANSAVAVHDRDLRYVYVSQRYLDEYGVKERDIIGKHHYDVFPDLPQKWRDVHQRALAGEVLQADRDPYPHKDGTVEWTRWECRPWYDAHGAIGGIIVYTEVITERLRAEEKLRASEEFQRAIIAASPLAIITLDPEGRVRSWNDAAERIFGWTREEAVGQMLPYVADEQMDTFAALRKQMLDGKTFSQLELTRQRKDGSPIDVRIATAPIRDREGRATAVVAVLEDITEQKRAEAAQAEQKALLEAIYRNAPLVLMVVDRERRVRQVNGFASQFVGRSTEEMLGLRGGEALRCVYALDHEDGCGFGEMCQQCIIRNTVLATLEHGTTHLQVEASYSFLLDGETHDSTLLLSTTPIDVRGEHMALVTMQDISERKRNEVELALSKMELERANRELQHSIARAEQLAVAAEAATVAKSEFLANMSHEIRTPMTAILGFAKLAQDGCPAQCEFGQGTNRECLATITRNGEHLLQLLNDILDLSKVEAGRLAVERIDVSPLKLTVEVASLIRVRSDAKGLELRVEFDGLIPETIRTDPTRLRQILLNLLGNAIKFTEQGCVSLLVRMAAASAEGPALAFDVVDTGVGMTAAETAVLFQPFSQADTSTTRRFGGTGLGLAVSKRLAEALGGDIQLVETRPGAGSRFRLSVATGPLDGIVMLDVHGRAAQQQPQGTPATPQTVNLQAAHILLAEDGVDNQRLIVHLLNKAGADVVLVEDGKLAAESALAARDAGKPFDVVLMDMQMPVMDGYEATALLRREGYEGPIIALTAHAMEGDRQKCLNAGCDDYLSKPMNRTVLLETVARHANAGGRSPKTG